MEYSEYFSITAVIFLVAVVGFMWADVKKLKKMERIEPLTDWEERSTQYNPQTKGKSFRPSSKP